MARATAYITPSPYELAGRMMARPPRSNSHSCSTFTVRPDQSGSIEFSRGTYYHRAHN